MWNKLAGFGMLGTITYVFHVVLGGILWEGYNHLIQPISDLTAQGAPDRVLLTGITSLYGIFSIIFAFSACKFSKKLEIKSLNAGFIMFLCMHIISILYNFFPQDLPGSAMSFRGFMHLVITGAIVPLTIISILLIGIGFKRVKSFRRYSVYSILTSIILLTAGGITVIIMSQGLNYFGLFERLNIGSLQLWMFIISLAFYKADPNKSEQKPDSESRITLQNDRSIPKVID